MAEYEWPHGLRQNEIISPQDLSKDLSRLTVNASLTVNAFIAKTDAFIARE